MKNDVNLINLYESVISSEESNNPQLVQLLMECTTIQVPVNACYYDNDSCLAIYDHYCTLSAVYSRG